MRASGFEESVIDEAIAAKERNAVRAAESGRQPRGKRYPEIVPEFRTFQKLRLSIEEWKESGLEEKAKLSQQQRKLLSIQGEAKVVKVDEVKEGDRLVDFEVGIYHTVKEFTDKALHVDHPFDGHSAITDDLLVAAFNLLVEGPDEIQRRRIATFHRYRKLKDDLADKEEALHKAIKDPARRKVIEGKCALLLKAMAKDAGIKDTNLGSNLVTGIDLVGDAVITNEFPRRRRLASLKPSEAMKASKWTRRVAMAKSGRSGDPLLDKEVWTKSEEEIKNKWIRGPFTEARLKEILGPLFVISRRFGIWQKGSARVIDDFSESLINAAFGAFETIDLGGVDELAILARTILRMVADDGTVKAVLSTGEVLQGMLHHTLTIAQARALAGRTLDLKSAYKQLLIAEGSSWAAVIRIYNPNTDEDELFIADALPFGASASVFGFNRFSRALCRIGIRLFGLIWTNFYDDFPQLDLECMGEESKVTAEQLMLLLGWRVSLSEEKRKDFSRVFDALGVSIDLSCSEEGEVVVTNKDSRVAAIRELVEAAVSTGSMGQPLAAMFRGKIQHAEGQIFGRLASLLMPETRARAGGQLKGTWLSEAMAQELRWAANFLATASPRKLLSFDTRPPLYVFTDAALEGARDELATYGGVVIDEGLVQYFQGVMRADSLEVLQEQTTKVITVLEVLPAVAAAIHWSKKTLHRRVFMYIDNDAARAGLIKMYSPVQTIHSVLKLLGMHCAEHPAFYWYARVPSSSNIADNASRFEELEYLGKEAEKVTVEVDALVAKKGMLKGRREVGKYGSLS